MTARLTKPNSQSRVKTKLKRLNTRINPHLFRLIARTIYPARHKANVYSMSKRLAKMGPKAKLNKKQTEVVHKQRKPPNPYQKKPKLPNPKQK